MQRLDKKIALVTGAASGIGQATAIHLASEGARIMLADINEQGLQETLATIIETGGEAHYQLCNVAKREDCEKLISATLEQFGGLDILCNIAGIAFSKHFADVEQSAWQRMVDINLNGVFNLCQLAMPHLLERKGNIVNMSSTAALDGQIYNAAYCATKGAVLMLTKALAIEFATQGVRVNAICPGLVQTPLVANFSLPDDADMMQVMKMAPILDPSEPIEIAKAVAYLASEDARYITGIGLPIDGGQTIG